MARDPLVSQNYAQALFNVMDKQGASLDDALRETEEVRKLLQTNPKFRIFFEGPQFREELKEEIAQRVLQGQVSETFFRFIIMLLRHNRIDHLFDILEEFMKLVMEKKGIVPGVVTTAVPLSDEQRWLLQEKLEAVRGLKFNFKFQVDPKLIGGVKVRYGDTLFDSSIATYLKDLRQRLTATRLAS